MRLALVLTSLLSLGACAVSEDRPDLSCKSDSDCFQAQGETCDTTKHVCVASAPSAGPDAGAAIAPDDVDDVDDPDDAVASTSIGGAP